MDLIPNEYKGNYISFKQELDTELNKAADGFVKIGYLLKVARDTDVLKESGYNTVAEFAQVEYGLTKDTVSRYININDRFSEGGYSPVLAGRFHNYGLAKLQEMLTLPDNIVDAIPEDVSKEDIRTIKKELAEEQQISDIEVAIEAAEQEGKADKSIHYDDVLTEIIKQYFHDNPDDYIACGRISSKDAKEEYRDIISPAGSKVIMGRIPGKGKYIVTIKDINADIIVANMRDVNDKKEYTWDDLINGICLMTAESSRNNPQPAMDMWEAIYGEPYPQKQEKDKTGMTLSDSNVENRKKKDKPKKKKVEVVNKKKAEVEVVPGVKVEIEDVDKAYEAAKLDIKKAEIEAAPNYTDESDEKEVAPAQPESIDEPESNEVEAHHEVQVPHHSKLDTERHWSEVYDIIEDQYQQLKRCLRNYDIEASLKFTVEIRTQILGLKEWPMKDDEG